MSIRWIAILFWVLAALDGWGMDIYVRMPNGTQLTLDVEAGDSIENVKAKVQDQSGFPPDRQSFLFMGRVLEDGRTLSDYNIQKKSILQMLENSYGWFSENNGGIADETGLPAEGTSVVTWRDTEIKPTSPTQVLGNHDELGVVQRQSGPDLQAHVLVSFADVFGTGAGQIPPTAAIDDAKLWVYVVQAVADQVITVAGLDAADADWIEAEACHAYGAGTTAWSGGTFTQSVVKIYGTFMNPVGTGWFSVDVSAALRDYCTNGIGGIALLSDSESQAEIRNFYFASDEVAQTNHAPGLRVAFSSYSISTNAGGIAGGNSVTLAALALGDGSDVTHVWMGGVAATVTGQGIDWVTFSVPAHAMGTVDVVVQSTSRGERTFADAYTFVEPTLVVLYDFALHAENGQVSVCWETASEEKTAGFDVYRWTDGAWTKVNGAFVYAQGVDGLGASYCVVDGGANATDEFRYKLVETESGGGTQEYGPFDVAAWGLRLDNVVASAEGVTIRWLGRAQDTYEIWKSVDLMRGFERLASGIAGVEPVTSFTDENAAGKAFYRIRAERE